MFRAFLPWIIYPYNEYTLRRTHNFKKQINIKYEK